MIFTLLLLATCALYGGFYVYTLRQVGVYSNLSFSEHIAKSKWTVNIGRFVIPLTSILCVVWMLNGYASAHSMPIWAKVTMVAIGLSASAAGLIPFDQSVVNQRIHNRAAWLYAVLVGALDVSALYWIQDTASAYLVMVIGIIQIVLLTTFIVFLPARKYFLQLQTAYIGLFAVVLLITAWL